MARIGFIGLGNMGGPMARNLVKAGHTLKVFDLSEEAMNYVVQSGASAASSIADAATDVEFFITMLPVGGNVRDVYFDGGALGAASPGTLLIDSSTIDVDTAQATHAAATEAGLQMLDAPVSGGVAGADSGTLTFMCGGEKSAFEKAQPILQGMGKNIVHCGAPGLGQVTKICNNMVAGITTLAVCEAFVMGETLGVDRSVLYDVLSTSSGGSTILKDVNPMPGVIAGAPASNDFKPGFAAKLMLKDLRLSQAAAQTAGISTPLGATATAAYAMHIKHG
ncbi:MAG: 3-hydroxyisobutyrate dehydrogenase, partial [Gammaproteobacteria bacterium]|nr:3-hydroxyisobutyrate dehydrogenase [Gammaproteobacteria bacterium]